MKASTVPPESSPWSKWKIPFNHLCKNFLSKVSGLLNLKHKFTIIIIKKHSYRFFIMIANVEKIYYHKVLFLTFCLYSKLHKVKFLIKCHAAMFTQHPPLPPGGWGVLQKFPPIPKASERTLNFHAPCNCQYTAEIYMGKHQEVLFAH